MNRKELIYTGGSIVAATILYLVINNQIKKKLIKKIYAELDGTLGSSEKIRIEKILDGTAGATKADAFNPKFFQIVAKEQQKGNPMDPKIAIQFAKDIHSAFGFWNDNEEKITGALKSIGSKFKLSFVAFWYYKEYKQDLYSELNYRLSDDEKKVVFGIVEKLPSI